VAIAAVEYIFGAHGVNTNSHPTARSFELLYAVVVEHHIKHSWREKVMSAVYQDYLDYVLNVSPRFNPCKHIRLCQVC
jgi:hypothetical protein